MGAIIFTDIDGVLNTINRNEWSTKSCQLYEDLCQEFDLKPVIISSWRVKHSIKELQRIFEYQGIFTTIYDTTPIITSEGRGGEIESWLSNNPTDNYIILDDNTRDIELYGLKNIIKCRSWLGFTTEEYNQCRNILKNIF